MKKLIIFGTGKTAEHFRRLLDNEQYSVIAYADNNVEIQGKFLQGVPVISPAKLKNYIFDKIIICSVYYDEIYYQLTVELGIQDKYLENKFFIVKEKLLSYYQEKADIDAGQFEALEYLKQHPLMPFNNTFVEKYSKIEIEVFYDETVEMYYVYFDGKQMYLPKRYNTKQSVINYCKSIYIEQDILSPHKYRVDSVASGSTVLDAGVAEGNFALAVIDKVKKIYLVECDEEWINALKVTFKPYWDKVVFIYRYLTDSNTENTTTIDDIVKEEKIDFIKLDIEGEETRALKGAKNTLRCNDALLDVCCYHHNEDETEIKEILWKYGYKTTTSQGYMVFVHNRNYEEENIKWQLIHGLVRAGREW